MLDSIGKVLDRFLERLPDNYSKTTDSNVYKLLQVAAQDMQENEDVINQIDDWRDTDLAGGTTLDLIGANVQQTRGQATDEVYRVLIKSKIKRNLSDGSINTLIDFISFILNVDPAGITITELWESENRPAALHIDAPAGPVAATGLSLKQFGTLINLVTAAGVRAEVLFEGTFSFSSAQSTSETDANAGFADTAETSGGTLGETYDPNIDYVLPF